MKLTGDYGHIYEITTDFKGDDIFIIKDDETGTAIQMNPDQFKELEKAMEVLGNTRGWNNY